MATETKELIGKVVTGKVINGVVVLDEPGCLKEGTKVRVTTKNSPAREKQAATGLGERMLKFAGIIDDPDLPKDLAENIDHYLYGTPKRK